MVLRAGAAVMLVVGCAGLVAAPAHALECLPKAVKARGGPGLIEATAKSRARSVWIKKVRADRKLGPQYAAWLRASAPEYACRKIGRHSVCEASAAPCRLEPVVTKETR